MSCPMTLQRPCSVKQVLEYRGVAPRSQLEMDWRLTKMISAKSSWDKFSLYDSAGSLSDLHKISSLSDFILPNYTKMAIKVLWHADFMGFSKGFCHWIYRSVNLYLLTEKEANNLLFSYSLNLKNSHLDLELQIHGIDILFTNTKIFFWSKGRWIG